MALDEKRVSETKCKWKWKGKERKSSYSPYKGCTRISFDILRLSSWSNAVLTACVGINSFSCFISFSFKIISGGQSCCITFERVLQREDSCILSILLTPWFMHKQFRHIHQMLRQQWKNYGKSSSPLAVQNKRSWLACLISPSQVKTQQL